MIRIKRTDQFELNSLESWVKEKLDQGKSEFFPSKEESQ
jgi:hypothetical protein